MLRHFSTADGIARITQQSNARRSAATETLSKAAVPEEAVTMRIKHLAPTTDKAPSKTRMPSPVPRSSKIER